MSDGPTCETCGKETCPDADLPAFSEPVQCIYRPVYEALRASKDCDYGCSRDYTNQQISLWVVEAVEGIVTAQVQQAKADALREWVNEWPVDGDVGIFLAAVKRDGLARAYRLEADS